MLLLLVDISLPDVKHVLRHVVVYHTVYPVFAQEVACRDCTPNTAQDRLGSSVLIFRHRCCFEKEAPRLFVRYCEYIVWLSGRLIPV